MERSAPGRSDHAARKPGSRSTFVALLVAAAYFMETLDGTIIANALPSMADTFSSTPEALAAGMTAYLLSLAACIPASGWIADRFGARPVFATAIAAFTLASVMCGISGSVLTFTLSRVLQGMAGALMVPVGRLVVLRSTDPSELLQRFATLTWPALVAPILGPPVGGFITHVWSWRWIFFINVPFGAIALLLAFVLIEEGRMGERRPFDRAGFVLNGLSCAFVIFALDQLGQPGADWLVAAAVLAVAALLAAWALRHARKHPHPLIPLDAFRVPTFRSTMVGGSIARLSVSTMPFLMPLLFQVGLGMNAFTSGLLVLWYGVTNLGIKPFTSSILRRFGFRNVLLANTGLIAGSMAACAAITNGTPVAIIALLLMLSGATRSMQLTAINALSFSDMPSTMTPAANTLFNMAFQLSVALGIALGAIALRVCSAIAPPTSYGPDVPFHLALICVAALSLLALADFRHLDRAAGSTVTGHSATGPGDRMRRA